MGGGAGGGDAAGHKFTVGAKLVETCLEVTSLLVEASFVSDKLPLLVQASRALTRARVRVRIRSGCAARLRTAERPMSPSAACGGPPRPVREGPR